MSTPQVERYFLHINGVKCVETISPLSGEPMPTSTTSARVPCGVQCSAPARCLENEARSNQLESSVPRVQVVRVGLQESTFPLIVFFVLNQEKRRKIGLDVSGSWRDGEPRRVLAGAPH